MTPDARVALTWLTERHLDMDLNKTDKADEIAREIWPHHDPIGIGSDQVRRRIAVTLRSYRNEGLEEAARLADEAARQDEIDNGMARTGAADGLGNRIRSLKSKEPQG